MRDKVNQVDAEPVSIVGRTNLSDTAEQVLLDGTIGRPGRGRRLPASADQRETDEAERHTAEETCASPSRMPCDLLHRRILHRATLLRRNGRKPTTLYDRRVGEFVPPDFDVPLGLETPQFVLEPLGPEHCDRDYAAWTSSMEHIRSTPGWSESRWPREMTLDENRADLERHANDFRSRTGFTYTVLDPQSSDVIGCVYIYPHPDSEHDARARSWVRASRAELDTPLWRTVHGWLASDWPLDRVDYAPRT